MGNNGNGKRQSIFDIRVFCVGSKPLLMNQWGEEKMVKDIIFKERGVPDTTTPLPDRAKLTIFRDGDDQISLPTEQISSSLCEAGCDIPLKGKVNLSKAGGKVSKIPSFMDILDGEFVRLLLPDGTPAMDKDWRYDVRRVILKDGGTSCAVRAKFMHWAFIINVRVDLSKVPGLTLETVRKLFDEAGNSKGVGGFRKAFGRFVVADGGWLVTTVDPSTIVRPKAPAILMAAPKGRDVVQAA
jgi:hypothetical protein